MKVTVVLLDEETGAKIASVTGEAEFDVEVVSDVKPRITKIKTKKGKKP